MHLLLIEDDAELASGMAAACLEQGWQVEQAPDGEAGLTAATARSHDVLVVDRLLPGIDGLSLVQQLRRRGLLTPILFLTTLGGIDDRVQGLEAGGDDYLVKPFAQAELLARIRVLQRRATQAPLTQLHAGPLQMDLLARRVEREGREIELLPQEFRLLEYLMRHADTVVTRSMILEHVWDIHFDPLTSVVESHMSRLRAKLNAGEAEELIQTVRGAGYRLRAR